MTTPSQTRTIAITTKRDLEDPNQFVKKAIRFLRNKGYNVVVCPKTCKVLHHEKPELDFTKPYDLMVVFGGDGSILRTIQHMEDFSTPVLNINMGSLGFLSEARGMDFRTAIHRWTKGQFDIDERIMLRITVMRRGKDVFSHRALNEAVIARDALARMVTLKTTIDDRKLTTYTADGLIIATPTGSTAYSLSAGGPIVYPTLDAFIITAIAPHSFTQKPIILPAEKRLKIFVSTNKDRVHLTVDGQIGFDVKDGDKVKIKKSSQKLKLVRLHGSSFYKTLRNKLSWGSSQTDKRQ